MILGLIPSRLNSSRLKEKPLLEIDGLPIIIHTLKRALLSKKLDKVIVCTDHKKIFDEVKKHGGEAMITSSKHKNGTERIAEVSKKFKSKLVVDIQGDEPLIDPSDIDKVIDFHLKNTNFDIVVPSMLTKNPERNSLVKVLFNKKGKVLYFSRASIPYNFKNKSIKYYKDLSIVSFKPKILANFAKFEIGELEKIEGIELLRSLENNQSIGTFVSKSTSFSVDVNDDLLKAINEMHKNKIRKKY
jgi:3-deoxy-manno-octulosonate cytidylyltransferase (CMP-KDO synthetase)|tara:strand:- start:38 stop:769 length:732 start_codon:yes stop_codon:yes gene_type:complete